MKYPLGLYLEPQDTDREIAILQQYGYEQIALQDCGSDADHFIHDRDNGALELRRYIKTYCSEGHELMHEYWLLMCLACGSAIPR